VHADSLDATDEAVGEIAVSEGLRNVGRHLFPEDLPGSGVAPPRTLACLAVGLRRVAPKGCGDAAGRVVAQPEVWINTNRNLLMALKRQPAPPGGAVAETTPPAPKPKARRRVLEETASRLDLASRLLGGDARRRPSPPLRGPRGWSPPLLAFLFLFPLLCRAQPPSPWQTENSGSPGSATKSPSAESLYRPITGTPPASSSVLHEAPDLDAGFHLLYELKLLEARALFEAWLKSHPADPLGSASEAASYLFEECYQQGVLTSAFFLDDKRFLGEIPLKPDPDLRAAFFAADKQAQGLAQLRLKTNPNDVNALFAMTLSAGMEADYASLIEKHQLQSLGMIRAADKYGKRLLAVAPEAFDAYLTLGAANYIIGSLPASKRFFLFFAGIHGDKSGGIQQLEVAAAHGHYLRPFAKILLALAALRERRTEVARIQFKELVEEFPQNPLFLTELTRLQ
jgi:hypothetical protein